MNPKAEEPGKHGTEAIDNLSQEIPELPLTGWTRYQIECLLGEGGMARVYKAFDPQLKRYVALKIIRGDNQTFKDRLLKEARAQAQIDHDHVCKIYEVGEIEGMHYIAMQHIKGQTLDQAQIEMTLEQKVKIMQQVAEAIHAAHRLGIVHRDLKPSNIMIESTENGSFRPYVTDFGIAMETTSPSVTATGQIVGTPYFMSPEQLWGTKSLDRRTDIYSLGATFYSILTGRPPFVGSGAEIVISLLKEDPEPVRQINALIPKDIETIVTKCLEKDPQHRYDSCHALAEDLKRYLEGEPILARQGTWSYRASRFVARHKAGVAAVALVIIALLGGAVTTLWQAHAARQERDKAEHRFNQVRKLANSVVFELHDAIENLPGSTPARELLVGRALEYLDSLADEAGKDTALKQELAAAYDKIGDIQGGFGTSHLGQRQKAEVSYRKALAIREALVAAEPNNVDFRRKLSTSYTKLGDILWIKVDMNGALEFYGKALGINKKLDADLPNDTQIRSDLAISYRNFGYMHGANGRADQALENTRKAVVLFEELAVADSNNTKIQYELALSYDKVAEILTALTENHAEALLLMRKAQEIGERLAAAEPLNTKLRRGQAVGHFNVALVSAKLGDTKTGLDSSRKALAIFTEMLSADPQNEEFRQAVAIIQAFVCEMMIKNGEAAEAIKLLSQSLLTLEKSFAASPTDEIAHFRIANVQAGLGQGYAALASEGKTSAQKRLANWREARSWFQKSQEIYRVFRDAGKLTGEDGARLDTVIDEIAKCDTAIARLTGKADASLR